MALNLPDHNASRGRGRRMAFASAVAGLAVVGSLGLGLSHSAVQAQLKPDTSAQFGRAPLSFADIIERVKPAVVSIQVSGKVAAATKGAPKGRGQEQFPDIPEDNPLYDFFKRLPPEFKGMPQQRPMLSQGSGFVISPDGYIVTNNHVIDGGGKIQVSFDQDTKFDAELIGADSRTDLAVLKIKGNGPFKYVKFASNAPRVGDWVIAVGNPFGLGGTVTAGIVSALGRDIGSGPYDYMQIDAAVNRGNSGGPTFNLDGEVVGINTAIYSPSGGNVGIAFAVPAKVAMEVIEQLKAGGTVSRGWLGVKIQNVDEDTAASLGLTEAKGALISEITMPGPAAEGGLKSGDAILAVNGVKVNDSRDLARQIAAFSPGTRVDVRILRSGKEQTVAIKLGTFPSGKEVAKVEPAKEEPRTTDLEALGLVLAPGTGPNREGVLITDVDGSSNAAQKGLKSGDVILEVGNTMVRTPDDVANAIKEISRLGRTAVLLKVKSGDQVRLVPVQLMPVQPKKG